MGKIKVLHRAATTSIGGGEIFVMNHYKYMDHDKFQIDFLTRNAALKELKEVQELQMGVQVFTATELLDRELLVHQINTILDEGYDIIHMNTSYWVGFLIEEIAMQRKIPKIIVHAHSTGIDQVAWDKRDEALKIHEFYKSKFGKEHATHFCACSKPAAEWLFGSRVPREEIKIMNNAIEVQKYSFDITIRESVRKKLGIKECFVVGHVGRFAYQKNHEFLLNMFADIYKKNNKARLMLIGQGNLEQDINKMIDELGIRQAVLLLGWREDVNCLMQAMDVFAFPSVFEGLGIVLVEAQAAGLMCITNITVPHEVKVTTNLIYLPLDKDSWVDKVLELMDGYERLKMDEELVRNGYDVRTQAKMLEDFYLM